MRTGALLALVAVSSLHCSCRLALASPLQDMETFNADYPLTSPGVELLIPVMSAAEGDERYNRARGDDEPLSDIPDSAFTLDDGVRVIADKAPLATSALPNAHANDRKKVLEPEGEVNHRMRSSMYLKSMAPAASGRPAKTDRSAMKKPPLDVWRICQGLNRARSGPAHEVLLLLCAELLDATGPKSTHSTQHAPVTGQPRAQFAPIAEPRPACTCSCTSKEAPRPVQARRDYMPLGENADMVLRYMKAPRRRRPWLPPTEWAVRVNLEEED